MSLALTLVIWLGSAVLAAPAHADDSLDWSAAYDTGPLAEARQAYRDRRDPARAREAYTRLQQLAAERPDDVAVQWHYALACYYMGTRVVDGTDARRDVYTEGREAAERGLELDPDCGPCHLMTATNHALWAQEVGIFRTLVGLPKVKKHLNRAIELDPGFGGAAAERVSANIARALPRMMGGGKKRAERWIHLAMKADPVEPMNHAFYAELLLEDFGDRGKARNVAAQGLSLPTPGPEYVESVDALDDLREILERTARR